MSAGLVCLGKEAHKLDERDLAADLAELQNVFTGPRRRPWETHHLPRLRALLVEPDTRAAIARKAGITPRRLHDVQTVYRKGARDAWTTAALPGLRRLVAEPRGSRSSGDRSGVAALADAAGLSPRHVRYLLSGQRAGTRDARHRLVAAGADTLRHRHGLPIPPRGAAFTASTQADLATLAAFAAAAPGRTPERACLACGASLANRRAYTRYCGNGCKSRAARARRAGAVPADIATTARPPAHAAQRAVRPRDTSEPEGCNG